MSDRHFPLNHPLNPYIAKRTANGQTEVFGGAQLLGTEPQDTTAHIYGIALDIGTTTLAADLFHLPTGRRLAQAGMLNPQSAYARDVLSRVHYASKEGGLKNLHADYLAAFASLRDELVRQAQINPRHIYEVIYSGNTTMLHLAAGIDPSALGKYPYRSSLSGNEHLKMSPPGISPFGLAYLPPVISSFVGADISSGILATRLWEKQDPTLFIDIGTNGEMVLAAGARLAATSTAAGPAFEGVNISCGMRAAPGALEQFHIDSCGKPSYQTIGNVPAAGICGSGLIDIVGELVRTGAIDKSGRLLQARPSSDAKPAYYLSDKVFLTQQDIRQVQLAKGAIRAGIASLLEYLAVPEDEVKEVLIAGAFGAHLREESLLQIGLLPPSFSHKVRFAGNTSLAGAAEFLLDKDTRARMQNLIQKIDPFDLAAYPVFEEMFLSSLEF